MSSEPILRISRRELIRLMVLIEIPDDYENVDQGDSAARRRTSSQVWIGDRALRDRGCIGRADPGRVGQGVEVMPPLDVIEQDFETYFYVTKKGKDLAVFDDPRALRRRR